MREDLFAKVRFEGKEYEWGIWAEQLTAKEGTQVLATYADQFYAGKPAITRRTMDKGSVSYFGVFSEQPLIDAFVASLAGSIGLLKWFNSADARAGSAAGALQDRPELQR